MPLTEDGLYQLSLKREPRQGAAQALAPAEGNDLSISQKMSNFFGRGPEKRATGRAAVPQRVTTNEQREGSKLL